MAMQIIDECDDWKIPVKILPLTQAFPEMGTLANSGIPEFKEYSERKVVLTEDHDRLFGVHSQRAIVIPHEELVNILMDTYTQLYPNSDDGIMNIISLKNGAAVKIEMDLPLERPLDIGNGDISNLKLYAFNAYDKSFALKLRTGVFRLICQNGAMIGEQISMLRAADLVDGWSTKSLAAKISRIVNHSHKVTDIWQSWLDIDVPHEAAYRALTNRFPEKFLEPILVKSKYPMNLYSLYNLMTRRSTHDTRTERSRVLFDSNISSIFYGRKMMEAIKDVTGVESTTHSEQIMKNSEFIPYLDEEISDLVTVTDEIQHH